MRRVLRAMTATAMALAVWLVVAPARAAAPLCDTRGATTFAPPPTLQPPMASIDVSSGDGRECERPDLVAAYQEGRDDAPRFEQRAPAPAALVTSRWMVEGRHAARAPRDGVLKGGSRRGVRRSIDRPPRRRA